MKSFFDETINFLLRKFWASYIFDVAQSASANLVENFSNDFTFYFQVSYT